MKDKQSSLPLVHALRKGIEPWREGRYKEGITETTKRLLEWWFIEDHVLNKETFNFWPPQRRGIESLVYAYEVLKARNLYELTKQLDVRLPVDPTEDKWAKYAFKMATGSGKTMVMAMSIVWSYFNYLYENKSDYTNSFLMIAPNLIVLDRLHGDSENPEFMGASIFKKFPLIPPEWKKDFKLDVIGPDDPKTPRSESVLFLTNWHKFVERENGEADNPAQELLGPKPSKDISEKEDLLLALTARDNYMVLNDEAHHVWDSDLVWYKAIDWVNDATGVMCQLDFSATPRYQTSGKLFTHIITDYSLGEAIEDQIVKRPKIAEIENVPDIESDDASEKYRVQIDAAVAKWKERFKEYKKADKKPILFVMADKTKSADQVAAYLDTFPELQDKVLTIHTNRKGEVSKREKDQARRWAREIDSEENPYRAIVSVLMLREGWDVRNVVVIAPLRPLTSEAKILPEQTLGRGLRRMHPNQPNWTEELLVIEHPAFHDIIDEALKEQGYEIEFAPIDQPDKLPKTIKVVEDKLMYDISVPVTHGGMSRSMKKLEELKITELPSPLFRYEDMKPVDITLKTKDLLTKQVESQEVIDMPFADRPDIYIGAIAKKIEKFSRSPGQFDKIVPITKEYIQKKLFDKKIEFNKEDLKKLNSAKVRVRLIEVFIDQINELTSVSEDIDLTGEELKASDIKPFMWSKDALELNKSILNLTPVANKLEAKFAKILDNDDEVLAFIKNDDRTLGFRISYIDNNGFVRYYVPDFIAKTEDNYWILETKGKEDVDVKHKDKRTEEWCEAVNNKQKEKWHYARINQRKIQMGSNFTLSDLV